MKIEQLIQAVEIAAAGSMTTAAQNLFMAQSNLSTSMKALETELNQKIFLRSNNGTFLTPFGQEFIQQAKITIQQFEYIKSLGSIQNRWNGKFCVASYYFLFAARLYIDVLKSCKKDCKTFEFIECSRKQVIEAVLGRSAEVGVLSILSDKVPAFLDYIDHKGLEYQKISEEPAHVLVGKGSRFFDVKCNTLDFLALRGLPCIDYYAEHESLFDNHSAVLSLLEPDSLLRVSDRDSLLLFLEEIDAYHLATKQAKAYKEFVFHERVRAIPIENCPVHFEIGFIKMKGETLSALGTEYLLGLQKFLVLDQR